MEKERDRLTDRQKEIDKQQVLYFVRTERKGFRVRESKIKKLRDGKRNGTTDKV